MTTANKKLIPTVCHSACGSVCGLLAHVENGVLTKIEAQDMPDPRHRHICARGLSTIQMVYHPDRLLSSSYGARVIASHSGSALNRSSSAALASYMP
ncbi:MAG: hypothetical protein HQ553_15860 [Chloroflexi bacterium]|nr:hypothetical protein [Chloroflexota bacterium]